LLESPDPGSGAGQRDDGHPPEGNFKGIGAAMYRYDEVDQKLVDERVAQFGDQAVAGMAIMGRLSPVAFAVIFALSGAVGPIIGQNFGARRYDRVRETLIAALQFTGLYVLAIAVALSLVRDGVVMLFSARGLTQDIIYLFCGPLALAYFFNGAVFVSNAAFNNLNRPFFSTLLNWGRHTLGTIPFVIVGAGMAGALGALIGQAAGGVFFGLFGIFTGFRLIRAYERGDIDPDAPPPEAGPGHTLRT